MNIEFHAPPGLVKEWVLGYLRDKLIDLHRWNKEIARVQVHFREWAGDKVCEIDLTIYGDALFVRREATSFEQASRETIKELTDMVDEQVRKQSEPPDEQTSTVEV